MNDDQESVILLAFVLAIIFACSIGFFLGFKA